MDPSPPGRRPDLTAKGKKELVARFPRKSGKESRGEVKQRCTSAYTIPSQQVLSRSTVSTPHRTQPQPTRLDTCAGNCQSRKKKRKLTWERNAQRVDTSKNVKLLVHHFAKKRVEWKTEAKSSSTARQHAPFQANGCFLDQRFPHRIAHSHNQLVWTLAQETASEIRQ
ncbi:hypothetical protein J3Q64DRAFT_1827666 [Phycomyces blakesleeanus]|uniref:Homeodomain-like DNA binding domain-containing transcription factor n=1 Tax=Phycomyces blakesleeanus TaxID=4837 RepID=A0ABR3BEK8_PHYBL